MRLQAALSGNLEKLIAQKQKDLESTIQGAVKENLEALKIELRQEVRAAGLGPRLANTWRSRFYKQDNAGIVYSNARGILSAFRRGVPIKAKNKRFLAVPTDDAPARGTNGRAISPANFPVNRFGPLHFVKGRKGKNAFLVATAVRSGKTGKLRGAKVNKKGNLTSGSQSVVMFTLIPMARMQKRLSFSPLVTKRKQAVLVRLRNQYTITEA